MIRIKTGSIKLCIKNLKKYYPVTSGLLKRVVGHVMAVDDVSLEAYEKETIGIVGESGCGKTTIAKCIMRLQEPTSGEIVLKTGDYYCDLTNLDKKQGQEIATQIQMVFQDPYSSFNPIKSIYQTLDEPLRIHGFGDKEQRLKRMVEMLSLVNIQPEYIYRYPHELSGGQRQRICIARALILNPDTLIFDEPVSSLDVSIQAQILNLMKELQRKLSLTYVFIAHDLSVVEYMSDKVAVMYLGKIVEFADKKTLYNSRSHPYTRALLSAVPIPKSGAANSRIVLAGDVPSPMNPPKGCRFSGRCPECVDSCHKEEPLLKLRAGSVNHWVACHLVK